MDDTILVALQVEDGRKEGELVHYVGMILDIEEDGHLNVSFLRVVTIHQEHLYVP